MKIQPIQFNLYNNRPLTTSNPTFEGGGKPITLQYAVEKRAHLIPRRVLDEARKRLAAGGEQIISLMELHKEIYGPLLGYQTLRALQEDGKFPEFNKMTEGVSFERNSRYAREFQERTDENFALKMLQEFWVKLKTKDEIARDMGMTSRSSLEWPLKQIGFVSYNPNYKTLLNASDEEGNRLIASKTTAWNAAHPDLMYARNKHAAQGCKTEAYREAHSKRMKEYDILHPERREKIARSSKLAWDLCPEVRKAMAEFALTCPGFMRRIVVKHFKGQKLTVSEERTDKIFFKKFWTAYPELKEVYAKAKRAASESLK